MERRAFTLRLAPGALAAYKHKHDEIWPELVAEIERSGIATMTAFEADPLIVYYSEITDEEAWDKLWSSEIHDRWANEFKGLIAFGEDGRVEAGSLHEIFHLDTNAR
jgi:L-rhamnose mutarotase